jgi:hypothetical protein
MVRDGGAIPLPFFVHVAKNFSWYASPSREKDLSLSELSLDSVKSKEKELSGVRERKRERISSQKGRPRRKGDPAEIQPFPTKGHAAESIPLSFRPFLSLPRGTSLFSNLPQFWSAWNWVV